MAKPATETLLPRHARLGLTCRSGSPRPMPEAHWHNEIELNYLEAGAMLYLFGGARVPVEAGRLALFWGAMPHQLLECAPETRFSCMTIPLAWFLQWRLDDSLTQRVLHGELVVETSPPNAAFDQDRFQQWTRDIDDGSADARRTALLEVEARLRRFARNVRREPEEAARSAPSGGAGEPGLVERMAAYIAERYTEPLTIPEIAGAVHLNPRYAMTLFRKVSGMTLLDCITQHRLSHAQRLLVTTDTKMITIALDSGFGSVSRFYAVFRRACRLSPREYRRALTVHPP